MTASVPPRKDPAPPAKVTHLYTLVRPRTVRRLLAVAVAAFVVAWAAMSLLEAGLDSPDPPLEAGGLAGWLMELPGFGDHIDFELAGHPRSADLVAGGTWDDDDLRVTTMILVDYVFIAAYVTLLTMAFSGLAIRHFPTRAALGRFSARAALLPVAMGLLDAIENAALLSLVARRNQWFAAELAQWAASVKFVLTFVALGLLVVGGALLLRPRRRG